VYGSRGSYDSDTTQTLTFDEMKTIDETLAEMVKRGTVWVPTIDHNRYYIDAKDEYGFKAEAIQPLGDYIQIKDGKIVVDTR
jgi:hypothetical protein